MWSRTRRVKTAVCDSIAAGWNSGRGRLLASQVADLSTGDLRLILIAVSAGLRHSGNSGKGAPKFKFNVGPDRLASEGVTLVLYLPRII